MDVIDPTEATIAATASSQSVLSLQDFIAAFGDGLLETVRRQNPPVYVGDADPTRSRLLDALHRQPFARQLDVVQAVSRLLVDLNEPAAIINGEMGTGKTMMAIAAAVCLHHAGFPRTLVICPPHLVYKWRREIRETVPGARVWILNGPDTLKKLLQLRALRAKPAAPEFFVMGRVRMRMGFNWVPAFVTRTLAGAEPGQGAQRLAACPRCGKLLTDEEGTALAPELARLRLNRDRQSCTACGERLWTLTRGGQPLKSQRERVYDALQQLPTIGEKTAARLLSIFGEDTLAGMLEDNVYEFINLIDDQGDLVFSERQSLRMERALARTEFAFGQGGYQPTEFIKRHLPQGYFGLLIADEGHEYKNEGSAQGQAMGVLARKARKALCLTGTLMGGYADDLFYLLWRLFPGKMIEDGYGVNARGSLGPAARQFMRDHGVMKEIYTSREGGSRGREAYRTARGRRDTVTMREKKGPGFGPKGIVRYVLPFTAFIKLKELAENVLPPYEEHLLEVAMTEEQASLYTRLALGLRNELNRALATGDHSLLGVVLNCLLAWPDCCFRQETVRHPHTRAILAQTPALAEVEAMPKEAALVELCQANRAQGRRVLVYSTYSGTRDTTARLKALLDRAGFKCAVLRASVEAEKREDWVCEQVERGVEVLITNPELVKTGLDLLEFPTLAFMQTGYNVYTLQQAARRSWRIGQKDAVRVHFLGYQGSAQMQCLALMAKKIAVAQSTSGEMPESGLDVLNQDGESIEVELAKQLVTAV